MIDEQNEQKLDKKFAEEYRKLSDKYGRDIVAELGYFNDCIKPVIKVKRLEKKA